MPFFGGLINLKLGIDGIAVDRAGQYVYYAAMAHNGLYRVPCQPLPILRCRRRRLPVRSAG